MTHDIRRRTALIGCLGIMSGAFGAGGCAPDTNAPQQVSPDSLFWQMDLNAHAVTLALGTPFDTVQLTVTPRNVQGEMLVHLPAPTFSTSDTLVSVTSNGLVTARAVTPAAGTRVVVHQDSREGVSYTDTVIIRVMPATSVAHVASFAFVRAPGDSAVIRPGSSVLFSNARTLQVRLLNDAGAALTGMPVYFSSSNPRTAAIGRANGVVDVTDATPGPVTFYASALVYGTILRDSVAFTVGESSVGSFSSRIRYAKGDTTPQLTFVPSTTTIGVGGVVTWQNETSIPLDVVFDDPTEASRFVVSGFFASFFPSDTGNIAPFTTSSNPAPGMIVGVLRAFLHPGTFHFHSARFGTQGTIIVR